MSLQQIRGLYFFYEILILPFVTILVYIFSSLGYRKMFQKGGLKGWYGFVPVFREYQLAVLAEHEEEGRTYFRSLLPPGCHGASARLERVFGVHRTLHHILCVPRS